MKEIKNILICGAGMMGKNIGYVFASNPSFQVGMYDLYPTDVEAGIRTNTKQLLDKGRALGLRGLRPVPLLRRLQLHHWRQLRLLRRLPDLLSLEGSRAA